MSQPLNRSVVEQPPDGPSEPPVSDRALTLRVRQQEILAELGVVALRGTPFTELLDAAVRLAAEGLEAEFCKILEYIPSEKRLLMRAGVGWDAGVVGKASVGADLESPAGFALHTGKPVISNSASGHQSCSPGTAYAGLSTSFCRATAPPSAFSRSTAIQRVIFPRRTSPSCRVRQISSAWPSSVSATSAI